MKRIIIHVAAFMTAVVVQAERVLLIDGVAQNLTDGVYTLTADATIDSLVITNATLDLNGHSIAVAKPMLADDCSAVIKNTTQDAVTFTVTSSSDSVVQGTFVGAVTFVAAADRGTVVVNSKTVWQNTGLTVAKGLCEVTSLATFPSPFALNVVEGAMLSIDSLQSDLNETCSLTGGGVVNLNGMTTASIFTGESFTGDVYVNGKIVDKVSGGGNGIVLNGGVLRMTTTGSQYSGETSVGASSRLVTGSGGVWAKYLRFSVQNNTHTSRTYAVKAQVGEIVLRRDGAALTWPAGTVATQEFNSVEIPRIVDNQASYEHDAYWEWDWRTATAQSTNGVVITLPSLTRFTGYSLYTGNGQICDITSTAEGVWLDANCRHPVSWTLQYSVDGITWIEFDKQVDNWKIGNPAGEQFEIPRGPNDASLFKDYFNKIFYTYDLNVENVTPGSEYAKYIRLKVDKTSLNDAGGQAFRLTQLSEVEFFRNGERIDCSDAKVEITATSSSGVSLSSGTLSSIVDGKTDTSLTWRLDGVITITFPYAISLDGYSLYTAKHTDSIYGQLSYGDTRWVFFTNGTYLPVSWRVECSMDGVNWTVFDNVVYNWTLLGKDGNTTFDLRSVTNTFNRVNGNYVDDKGNLQTDQFTDLSLKDTLAPYAQAKFYSYVQQAPANTLSPNSALNIDGTCTITTAEESVPAITGAGRVELGTNTRLILTNQSGAFNGTITGGELVLKGGTLSGTAKAEGDLTLTAAGGIYDATITDIAKLTLKCEGDNTFLIKNNAVSDPIRKTLFAFSSLGEGTENIYNQAVLSPAASGAWKFTLARDLESEEKTFGYSLVKGGMVFIIR